jgi:SpoVK/Ycf46/Vps4 family AAA+-type ATPase
MSTKKPKLIEGSVNSKVINFIPTDCFWESLNKRRKDLSYTCTNQTIKQVSKNEYTYVENWEDVQINTPTFCCTFDRSLTAELQLEENVKEIKKIYCGGDYSKYRGKTIFDLIPFKGFVKFAKSKVENYILTTTNSWFVTIDTLNETFQFKDKLNAAKEFNLLLHAVSNGGLRTCDTIFGLRICDPSTIVYYDRYLNTLEFPELESVKEWFHEQTSPKLKSTSSLSSDNFDTDLEKEWNDYLKEIQKYTVTKISDKVKIYDITLETVEAKEDSKHTFTVIEDKIITENNKSKMVTESKKYTKIIRTELINEVSKSFDTLYLKDNDRMILESSLKRFKDQSEIYSQLGLPYKFCAMLHGKPGTGKSSAITAIATYLSRNIYYLDLTNITSNTDLKRVFNHINKEQCENGIIVVEDIDAMTNVVHKRTSDTKNDALTLECFLNLLQGTLTAHGSMFITTTNHIEKLDPAFYRDGRFDVNIHLEECDHFQMNTIYKTFLKRKIPEDLLAKLPELTITPATFIAKILPYVLTNTSDIDILENIMKLVKS